MDRDISKYKNFLSGKALRIIRYKPNVKKDIHEWLMDNGSYSILALPFNKLIEFERYLNLIEKILYPEGSVLHHTLTITYKFSHPEPELDKIPPGMLPIKLKELIAENGRRPWESTITHTWSKDEHPTR